MGPIIALELVLLATAPAASGDCETARAQYEALALEEALATAKDALKRDPARPLACLEVKALVHLVLNEHEDAKAALTELFERAPDHLVEDPSLSPATRETIAAIRESVRPLEAKISLGWIIRESLRMDVLLEGGLRGATRVRYRTEARPAEEVRRGEVLLLGRAATATITVSSAAQADRVLITGQVLDDVGRVLHQFSSELVLPARPPPSPPAVEVVESGGVPWPVWLAVAAAVIGAGVTIGVLAQPDRPDFDGTTGGIPIDP